MICQDRLGTNIGKTNSRKALKRQNVRHGVELSVVLVRFHLDLVDEFNVRPPDLRALQRLQEHGTLLSFPYVCPEPVLVK
jgi:hypothetical protein